jgi:hypothetical protein
MGHQENEPRGLVYVSLLHVMCDCTLGIERVVVGIGAPRGDTLTLNGSVIIFTTEARDGLSGKHLKCARILNAGEVAFCCGMLNKCPHYSAADNFPRRPPHSTSLSA